MTLTRGAVSQASIDAALGEVADGQRRPLVVHPVDAQDTIAQGGLGLDRRRPGASPFRPAPLGPETVIARRALIAPPRRASSVPRPTNGIGARGGPAGGRRLLVGVVGS